MWSGPLERGVPEVPAELRDNGTVCRYVSPQVFQLIPLHVSHSHSFHFNGPFVLLKYLYYSLSNVFLCAGFPPKAFSTCEVCRRSDVLGRSVYFPPCGRNYYLLHPNPTIALKSILMDCIAWLPQPFLCSSSFPFSKMSRFIIITTTKSHFSCIDI